MRTTVTCLAASAALPVAVDSAADMTVKEPPGAPLPPAAYRWKLDAADWGHAVKTVVPLFAPVIILILLMIMTAP